MYQMESVSDIFTSVSTPEGIFRLSPLAAGYPIVFVITLQLPRTRYATLPTNVRGRNKTIKRTVVKWQTQWKLHLPISKFWVSDPTMDVSSIYIRVRLPFHCRGLAERLKIDIKFFLCIYVSFPIITRYKPGVWPKTAQYFEWISVHDEEVWLVHL